MSAGVEEAGAIVTVGTGARATPNVAATTVELTAHLQAFGQNAWPNVRWDLGAVSDGLHRFISAGFYYKTFMGLPPFETGQGTGFWMRYEKLIRAAAGMGRLATRPDPDHYEHRTLFCDLLVVGGGPAGLKAAQIAAQQGSDVVLVEQDFVLGGQGLVADNDTSQEIAKLVMDAKEAGVRFLMSTVCLGLHDDGVSLCHERLGEYRNCSELEPRSRLWTVNSNRRVIATGAIERTFAFHNNDRPGVMTPSAALSYLNRFGVLAGQNVVVATNNDSSYRVAAALSHAGASVTLSDTRAARAATREIQDLEFEHMPGSHLVEVSGRRKTRKAGLRTASGDIKFIDADLVLASGGWSPVVHLASHLGHKPVWRTDIAAFVPDRVGQDIRVVGSAAGIFDHACCLESGERSLDHDLEKRRLSDVSGWQDRIEPLYETKRKRPSRAFVDPMNDVTTKDIRLAQQEGFASVEHLKRYTTLGMAGDQGKVGNIIGMGVMAAAAQVEISDLGTTTFRPPYRSVSLGALAGAKRNDHLRPIRRTPLHDWQVTHSAVMTEMGFWHRAWWFEENGESIEEAAYREAATVRKSVGLCDVSTLGKFVVAGQDAADFLNRIFVNNMVGLTVGKTRYGVLLRDDGIVSDDAVVWRRSETEYFLTSTSAQADGLFDRLEYLLVCRWPDLQVVLHNQTDQWAAMAIAGPRSREVVQSVLGNPSLVSDSFMPFMHFAECRTEDGLVLQIARVSFSGERAFEIYTPADFGPIIAARLEKVVRASNGCLYGLEALDILRIEKGHVADGEIDGNATLGDLGMERLASKTKPFVGKAMASRPGLTDPTRPSLVGLMTAASSDVFSGGAILCSEDSQTGHGLGWVTVAAGSPSLGRHIGLGFLRGGHDEWEGKHLLANDPVRGKKTRLQACSPHMFDPAGDRMRG